MALLVMRISTMLILDIDISNDSHIDYYSHLGCDHNTRNRDNIHIKGTHKEYAKITRRYNLPNLINETQKMKTNKAETHSLHCYTIYANNIFISEYGS